MVFVKCSLVALALLALQHQTLAQVLASSGSANGGLFGSGNENEGDLSAGDNSAPAAESNGYLPPIGSSSSENIPAFSGPPKEDSGRDDSPTNVSPNVAFPAVQPQLGCAAALICVEEQFCNTVGVISKTPLQLTEAQKLRRVPMVDCRNPDNGVIGKCCRDPDYVDPWPAGNLSPEQLKQGFDEQGFPKFLNLGKNKPQRPSRPSPVANPTNQFGQTIRPQQPFGITQQPARPIAPIQPSQTGFAQNKIVPESKPFQPQPPQFGQAIESTSVQKPFQPKNPFLSQPSKPFQPEQPEAVQPEQPRPIESAEFPQQARQPEIVVAPEQPIAIAPEQPEAFVPQQPEVFIPQQPQQPQPIIPEQSQAFIPQQKPFVPQPPSGFQKQPTFTVTVTEQPQVYQQPGQAKQPEFIQPQQPQQPEYFQPAQPQQPVQVDQQTYSQTKEQSRGPFENFGQGIENLQQTVVNAFNNANPFKPQQPDSQNDTPAPVTTSKPFLSNLPVIGNFFGQKNVGNQQPIQTAPVSIAPHTPGAQCGIINQVQQNYAEGFNDVQTPFGQIPWQAMVLHNADRKLLCSGAVIAPNVVMTAAHCVYGMNPSEVSIKVGEWKLGYELKHEEPLPFEIAQVQHIETHPGYQPGGPGSDLAMLFLERPVKLDQHVDTICLSQQPSALQRKCISVGWGKTVLQMHAAGALMNKLEVDTLSQDECRLRLQGAESPLDIDDSLVCVKTHKQNNNLCQVDVGGPLACDRGDGHYELVGVYSQDTGCLPTNQVATFALIDSQWVNNMLNSPAAVVQQTPEGPARGNYQGPQPGNYQGPQPGNYQGPQPGNYERPQPVNYEGPQPGNYERPQPVNYEGQQPGQEAPSRIHYHPQQPGVPCDCQQGTQPAGVNAYLPPY